MGLHVVPAREEEAEALRGTLSLGAWCQHHGGAGQHRRLSGEVTS
jgi:hypothetical protein